MRRLYWRMFALGLLCSATSNAALAQSLGSIGSDSESDRRDRLLKSLRAPPLPLGILGAEGEEGWVPKCRLGVGYAVATGDKRLVSTPLGCEFSRAATTIDLSSDGYLFRSGSTSAQGLADFSASASMKSGIHEINFALSGGLTIPSRSDVGGTKSDLSTALTVAPRAWGGLSPSFEYSITRNGDAQSAGGRSTQKVSAALEYAWTDRISTELALAHAKPSRDSASHEAVIRTDFSIAPSLGFKGRVSSTRSGGQWNNRVSVRIRHEF